MPDARFWIVARLEGDALRVSVYGAETYLDDDPVHRTRESSAHLDLMDPASLRSASAVLAPLVRGMSAEQKANLDDRRAQAVPPPDTQLVADLSEALSTVLATYRPSLARLTRRLARMSEDAAYRHDTYDDDGTPILPASSAGVSGDVATSKGGGA